MGLLGQVGGGTVLFVWVSHPGTEGLTCMLVWGSRVRLSQSRSALHPGVMHMLGHHVLSQPPHTVVAVTGRSLLPWACSLWGTGYGERDDDGEHVRKILNRVVSRVQCQA